MADPAIKAALKEATWTLARPHPGDAQQHVAAAITTFLRTLHRLAPVGVIMTEGGETYTADCARLAAAVEAAAHG